VIHYHNDDEMGVDAVSILELADYELKLEPKKNHSSSFNLFTMRRQVADKKNDFTFAFGFEQIEIYTLSIRLILACQKKLDLTPFTPLFTIGRGKFGKVIAARHREDKFYAVKEVDCTAQKTAKHVKQERLVVELLAHSPSPFVVHTTHAMKLGSHLYYAMELMRAGDLYSLLSNHSITLSAARFYAAEIVLALEHLHSLNILYRDLKPENILVSDAGHMKLADFGLASYIGEEGHAKTCCGTESYTPPEMLRHEEYRFSVDYWQLGCLIYELFVGQSPFYCPRLSKSELKQKILDASYTFPEGTLSRRWKGVLHELLQPEISDRLGSTEGWEEVKGHAFFGSLSWTALKKLRLNPPVTSFSLDDFLHNFDEEFTSEDPSFSFNLTQKTRFENELKGFDFQPHSEMMALAQSQKLDFPFEEELDDPAPISLVQTDSDGNIANTFRRKLSIDERKELDDFLELGKEDSGDENNLKTPCSEDGGLFF